MQNQIDYIVKSLDEMKDLNSEEHHAIIEHQKKTNGNVTRNTEFRLENDKLISNLGIMTEEFTLFKGGFSAIKWALGFVGLGNLVIIGSFLYTHLK